MDEKQKPCVRSPLNIVSTAAFSKDEASVLHRGNLFSFFLFVDLFSEKFDKLKPHWADILQAVLVLQKRILKISTPYIVLSSIHLAIVISHSTQILSFDYVFPFCMSTQRYVNIGQFVELEVWRCV